MSGFNSNFNDIQKQISFANLTDEQIQELMSILQTKRNVKPKLTKEEKVFYQCCREHRSYSANQDTDTVFCPVCGSIKIIKNGTKNGRQRYKCKDCAKTFGDTIGTVAFRSKLSIAKWIELIKLTLQRESCRTIAKELGINKQTVLHNRHRICSVLHQLVSNQDDFKSLAESDEYYYPLSFKDIKDPMFFLGTLGRMPYTHRNYGQKLEYIEKQGFDSAFLQSLIENEEQVRNELLNYVNYDDLKSQEKFSNALNGMDTEKIIQVLKTLNEQQKKKRGISNQQVCCLSCVDRNNNHFLQTVCVGRIWASHIEKSLLPHFTEDTVLITDSHRAYKTVANKRKIPLKQIPSGKHTSGGYSLGHINGYHHNISDFMYLYHGVSSKFLDYYLALFYWIEKNKDKTYLEKTYEIITFLSNQAKKIPLNKFKEKSISFDLKGMLS
ncbi:MAG: IS1595 family transposase [Ruminococcaceae bacterium]|nr:IS1595 family transposase [Oscillospiraceae bacterium]